MKIAELVPLLMNLFTLKEIFGNTEIAFFSKCFFALTIVAIVVATVRDEKNSKFVHIFFYLKYKFYFCLTVSLVRSKTGY